ncbi:MAG: hypothetical protein CVU90_14780 [Firmicutes bacterium HGW-Firmicutes-15]|nr:MAG: hypothetical protein CVU90_14780 [Firmicutes bacterium HGW-Firmicutes-15]
MYTLRNKIGTLGGIILFLLSISLALANPARAAETVKNEDESTVLSQFNDVSSSDANVIYVNYLAGKGIITGYPDGGYHPNEGITRAQAAVVIVKAVGLNVDSRLPMPFSDVPQNHWARDYIAAVAQTGYMSGYPGQSFEPDEKLSRAEGISLTLQVSKQPTKGAELPQLSDINNTYWAAPAVAVGLASGMVGISSDGKQYLPDEAFTRINMAHALGLLLTKDPGLNSTSLPGKIKSISGKIKIKSTNRVEQEIKKETTVNSGDIITTGANSSCELSYPDGSSMLIKENTEISIKESLGRKYIKKDGSEGIAVDWLNLQLKQGTMFGALATKNEGQSEETTTSPNETKKTGQLYQINEQLIATLEGWELLADNNEALPWWKVADTKKVKVKVDMPWGVAAIRGTFVMMNVSPSGQSSVSCLIGNAEVTNGGVTVPLTQGQGTQVTTASAPPAPSAPMNTQQVQLFTAVQSWINTTAQIMEANQEVIPPPPPPAVVGSTAPVVPAPPVTTPSVSTPSLESLLSSALESAAQNASEQPNGNSNSNNDGDSSPAIDNQSVYLGDNQLEGVIREVLNKPAGTITRAEMASLTSLSASGLGITNLSGLEYAVNLVILDLQDNHISDINALSALTNLKYLSIEDNDIINISPVENLVNLEALDFGGNQVTDISALDGLDGLKNLSMWDNPVANVDTAIEVIADMTNMEELHIDNMGSPTKLGSLSALSSMSNLTSLWATGNQISDISALSGKSSFVDLHLDNNSIVNIGALSGLTNLKYLCIKDNDIINISPVENLISLEALDFGGNQVTDISALADLNGLKNLSMWDNPVANVDTAIGVIANMTNMEELHIDNIGSPTKLSSLSDLSSMSNLTSLWATGNQISDISALSGKTSLMDLHLDNNSIVNIGALSGLINLKYLCIKYNEIIDISPVENLINLEALDFGGNQVIDISTLADLNGLKNLSMWDNPVDNVDIAIGVIENMTNMEELHIDGLGSVGAKLSSLEALASMDSLRVMWATGNQISDISALSGKTSLMDLHLDNNSIVNIGVLSGLTSLKYLCVKDNEIVNISPVENLINLEALDFGGNQVIYISALADLNGLKNLSMWDNPVEDVDTAIEVIADMTNMEELHIDGLGSAGAKLSNLSVAGMSELKVLWATSNQIADISVLNNKLGLREVHLENNLITDITSLATNCLAGGLGSNDYVNISNNPLSSQSTNIDTLQTAGVTVVN